MRPMFSIRMSEETRDQLKMIAALEKKPMGQIIEEMVAKKYARCKWPGQQQVTPAQGVQLQLPKPKQKHDKKKRGF